MAPRDRLGLDGVFDAQRCGALYTPRTHDQIPNVLLLRGRERGSQTNVKRTSATLYRRGLVILVPVLEVTRRTVTPELLVVLPSAREAGVGEGGLECNMCHGD